MISTLNDMRVWARDLALGKLISPAMKRPADQVLLRRNGEKWEDVGSYVGETVLLDESVRRQGWLRSSFCGGGAPA
jgi:hypothetical protein